MKSKVKLISIIVLLLMTVIIIIPPLVYNYVYPNVSDDSSEHLKVIDSLVINPNPFAMGDKLNYWGQWLVGYPISLTHNTDTVFLWFNFAVLIGIGLMIFFVVRKMINVHAAILAIPLVMFCSTAVISLFEHGIIFNLINMYLILLTAVTTMIYWITTQKIKWLLSSIVLFALFSLFHTSGLYLTYIIVPFGIILSALFAWKDHPKNIIRYLNVFLYCVGIAVINQVLIRFVPVAQQDAASTTINSFITNTAYSAVKPPTIFDFIYTYLSPMVVLFLYFGMMYILIYRTKVMQLLTEKGKIFLLFLIVTIAVLAFGSFTKYTFDPTRIAFDLAIITTIFTACISGLALTVLISNINKEKIKQAIISAISVGLIIGSIPILTLWFSNSSAIKKVDLDAIKYVNSLNGSTWSSSTEVQQLIYGRFINKEYISVNEDSNYVIYRNNPMTPRTREQNLKAWGIEPSKDSDFIGNDKYTELKRFSSGNITVIVFKNK